jgi:hypothetical protein
MPFVESLLITPTRLPVEKLNALSKAVKRRIRTKPKANNMASLSFQDSADHWPMRSRADEFESMISIL